ncbi:DUF721 domain-containing protein [Desulfonema ishimotonii]|uniref:DUF721 domain-containing protein n=1 Tax=Desulfonema ishimotonii TaxID=45657 RepID=UPI00140D3D4C|nr:DUF721 domain-containing protein [Desulfonema ishimotonii]
MKEFTHIGQVLPGAMKKYRRESDGELVRIWALWDQAVGPAVAENARPAAFRGDLLIVHVTSSPWVQQLRFLKHEIRSKVNSALGGEMVRDIRFRVGAL